MFSLIHRHCNHRQRESVVSGVFAQLILIAIAAVRPSWHIELVQSEHLGAPAFDAAPKQFPVRHFGRLCLLN